MLGTAAQTETGCFELDLGQVETGLPAGVADTAPNGALEPGAAFSPRNPDMEPKVVIWRGTSQFRYRAKEASVARYSFSNKTVT